MLLGTLEELEDSQLSLEELGRVLDDVEMVIKHKFKVDWEDIGKYTKSMVNYSGETYESWKEFSTKLKSCINKLAKGGKAEKWTAKSFENVINGKETLDSDTEELLLTIYADFLNGTALELTTDTRETVDFKNRVGLT